MSSKTFKSVVHGSSIQVHDNGEGVFIGLLREDSMTRGTTLSKSDAPALALAVLEAAGVDLNESWSGLYPYGTPSHLGWIGGHLRVYVRQFANDQDKARELAVLEAEALELYNVCMTGHNLTSFDGLGGAWRDQWLAVARRAREMRAEK